MDFKELKIGTRLELELESTYEKRGHAYVSQLLEPIKGNHFVVAAPIYEARLVYVPAESTIRVVFNHHIYGLLGFTAVVKKKENHGNIAVMIMQVTGEIESVQRRTFYRLDCLLDAEYRLHTDSKNTDKQEDYKSTIIKNISGSGACIILDENVKRNTTLDLVIYLDYAEIKTTCVVVRSTPQEIKREKKYELGVHFIEMSPKDTDLIVRFVFERQRLLLKKEVKDR